MSLTSGVSFFESFFDAGEKGGADFNLFRKGFIQYPRQGDIIDGNCEIILRFLFVGNIFFVDYDVQIKIAIGKINFVSAVFQDFSGKCIGCEMIIHLAAFCAGVDFIRIFNGYAHFIQECGQLGKIFPGLSIEIPAFRAIAQGMGLGIGAGAFYINIQ